MKITSILSCLLILTTIEIIAQDQLYLVTGEVIPVTKARYREKDNSLVFVNPQSGYNSEVKLWSVEKLVLEDGSELTYEEYDKTIDLDIHQHRDVYQSFVEPTNTELTLVVDTNKEFMNITEENAINEIRKIAYQQGGNILYVRIERNGNSGKFNVNYKVYSTLKFNPEYFETYNGTFSIEGFNDMIKIDDWSDPIFTTLGTQEKLIFKGDGVFEARSSKRIYEANLLFDNDNLTIDYFRVKKNGKRDEKSRSLRIIGNNEKQILALYNESGYLLELQPE